MSKPRLNLRDFVYPPGQRVRVPPTQASMPRFGYSDGDISEEYVLRSIQQASDVSENSAELFAKSRDWASFYHLGPGRANHLRALDLPRHLSVLELGSGCGAILRYLGENFDCVHAVEGSLRRATIARERCRDLSHVEVFCADFGLLDLQPDYDVVLLNGVLEYAPVFLKHHGIAPEKAAHTLLQLAMSGLRPGGVIIVAIENKIGLKYWSGADEDHTGDPFDSIHGYPTPGTAVTFSKKELTALLASAGLVESQFFGCYPDYKFATTILADAHHDQGDAYLHNWIPYPAENPGLERRYLIHEGLASKSLHDAGLIHEFANSFMVVASSAASPTFEPAMQPAWRAAKVSVANRAKPLHCVTKLDGRTASVVKTKIQYAQASASTAAVNHQPSSAPWIPGTMMSQEADRAMMSKGYASEVPALLKEYLQWLLQRYATGAQDSAGYPLVKGSAFDVIMMNLIRTPDGQLHGIDDEWQLEQALPADYLLFRSLNYDFVGANQYWAGEKIIHEDEFAIAMIRAIYPSYDASRHQHNRARERDILQSIRGDTPSMAWVKQVDRAGWKNAVKAVAKRIPVGVRRRIVGLSAKVHEKVVAIFHADLG